MYQLYQLYQLKDRPCQVSIIFADTARHIHRVQEYYGTNRSDPTTSQTVLQHEGQLTVDKWFGPMGSMDECIAH